MTRSAAAGRNPSAHPALVQLDNPDSDNLCSLQDRQGGEGDQGEVVRRVQGAVPRQGHQPGAGGIRGRGPQGQSSDVQAAGAIGLGLWGPGQIIAKTCDSSCVV